MPPPRVSPQTRPSDWQKWHTRNGGVRARRAHACSLSFDKSVGSNLGRTGSQFPTAHNQGLRRGSLSRAGVPLRRSSSSSNVRASVVRTTSSAGRSNKRVMKDRVIVSRRRVPRPISACMARQMGSKRSGITAMATANQGQVRSSSKHSGTFHYMEFREPDQRYAARKQPSFQKTGVLRGSTLRTKKREASILRSKGIMSRSASRLPKKIDRGRPSTARRHKSDQHSGSVSLRRRRPATASGARRFKK